MNPPPYQPKRFRRGLVVGKFAPLHRGHMYLIETALAACAEVVVIGYSAPEFPGCEAGKRESWLRALYPQVQIVVPSAANVARLLPESAEFRQVPENDAPAEVHRRFCAALLTEHLCTTVEAVFTSEDYGEPFAAALTCAFRQRDSAVAPVVHVCLDRVRQMVPISGTQLRADLHGHRQFLHPEVYASFVQRVCLLGAESTGKSTLAAALAREFGTVHVAEFGRELWEARGGELDFGDYATIAATQIGREESARRDPAVHRFVFCDTSPLTTWLYQTMDHGRADPAVERAAERRYDHTFLCAPDFALVQDGTRRDEAFRAQQHLLYRAELRRRGVAHVELVGPLDARVRQIRACLTGR